MISIHSLSIAFATVPYVVAQTWSSCNPLYKTGCSVNNGLTSAFSSYDFTQWNLPSGWIASSAASRISYGDDGATFTISQGGDNPTIRSDFYMLFGTVTVVMKSAPGTGIVSSVVLESDVLDEIDWEFIGGNAQQTQTNYFGKGNTSTYDRETWVAAPDSQNTFHTYTVNWQKGSTQWLVDGQVMRMLNYADANGGSNYPQTPMRVKIGTWAGGDTALNGAGTVTWAGGATNYAQGPFVATVQSVWISNAYPASSYTYEDQSGSYSSIRVNAAAWKRGVMKAFRA